VDFVESTVFGEYINPLATRIITGSADEVPDALLPQFLVGEYGLLTMGVTYAIAIVLPTVTAFFLVFSILEDSGYLPRLAAMANRICRVAGLNGRAVLPMVLGFGCGAMAVLTSRILETRRERVLATLLLALGIPCSAQLGVITGVAAGVSPYVFIVVCVTVLTHLLIVGGVSGRLLPGKSGDFVIELPPLRMPQLSNVFRKTLTRTQWYLREAVPLFLLGTAILFVLDATGALPWLIAAARPIVVGALGLPEQTAEAFIMGFLRRDYGAVVIRDAAVGTGDVMSAAQIAVALATIVLFVPCIANFLVQVKERGARTAVAIVTFVAIYSVLAGAALRLILVAVSFNSWAT